MEKRTTSLKESDNHKIFKIHRLFSKSPKLLSNKKLKIINMISIAYHKWIWISQTNWSKKTIWIITFHPNNSIIFIWINKSLNLFLQTTSNSSIKIISKIISHNTSKIINMNIKTFKLETLTIIFRLLQMCKILMHISNQQYNKTSFKFQLWSLLLFPNRLHKIKIS